MSRVILKEYLNYMEVEKNFSKNTLDAYRRDVVKFDEFVEENLSFSSLIEVEEEDVVEYLDYLKEEGRANSTISRTLASIRSIYQFLLDNKLINEDPTTNLKTSPIERKPPSFLTLEEVNRILERPDVKTLKGARDKAMIQILFSTGLRVSQMLGLDHKDVDLMEGCLSVEENNELRIIRIDDNTIYILKNYLDKYREEFSEEGAFFINIYGGRLSRQGFWKILREYAKKANLGKNVTPHTLRHSFATRMINSGVDLEEVQRMLGHSSITTTEVYLTEE